ncbi:cyclin-like protein [Mrakia frigida]|uniref:TFIIH complex kinase subunit CCL1 n=1 Tax=Mrakia frigida TaxID=29902 RepID=UPI003FCC0A93
MANAVASSSTAAPSSSKGTAPPPPSSSPTEALRPLYEESSQYRNWRYSKEKLAKMRKDLNERAVDVVRKNLQAEKVSSTPSQAQAEEEAYLTFGTNPPPPPTTTTPSSDDINYLTVEDELALIAYYISTVPPTCAGFGASLTVEATTILYLKRFYLVNTCMDYHPRKIMPTCLFLAMKAENSHPAIDPFVSRFSKLTSDEVLSLEFLVAQSLEFEFKVHHPHTALHGFFLDLQVTASPSLPSLLSSALSTLSALSLPLDLPLIYSPSHIALAAIHFHSPAHTTLYLQSKEDLSNGKLKADEVLSVLEEIVEQLKEEETRQREDQGGKKRMGKVKEVDRRLRGCGNPERVVGSALYRKRQAQEAAEDEVRRAKRLQKDRDARKNDANVFGNELVVIPQTEEGTRAVLESIPGGPMGDGAGEGEDPF